nr:MAG TPA: hypothetical protein [Caudoviricetes sp.]
MCRKTRPLLERVFLIFRRGGEAYYQATLEQTTLVVDNHLGNSCCNF